jgi:hypothetical protein
VFAEQQDVLGRNLDKTLEFDDLNKFDLLFNCIRETLRMHPPLLMLMRHCRVDLPVTASDGTSYVVPKVSTHTHTHTHTHREGHSLSYYHVHDTSLRLGRGSLRLDTPVLGRVSSVCAG